MKIILLPQITTSMFLIFILFFACVSLAQAAPDASDALPKPVGRVVWVKGELLATMSNQEERSLKKDSIIYLKDTLFTNANSQAQIVFTDNTLITFRPDTKFSVDQYEFDAKSKKKSVGKYIMNLLAGGFRTITGLIARKNPDDYQVNTPVATIGVRGTDFSVVLKDGQLLMAQYEGAPCLNSTTGQTLCLSKANPYGAVPAEGANPVQLATRPAVFETKELIEPVQTPPSFDAQTVRSTQPSPPPRGTISSFCITQ